MSNWIAQTFEITNIWIRSTMFTDQLSIKGKRLEVIDKISVLKCDNYNVVKNNFNKNNRLNFEWNDKYRLFSYIYSLTSGKTASPEPASVPFSFSKGLKASMSSAILYITRNTVGLYSATLGDSRTIPKIIRYPNDEHAKVYFHSAIFTTQLVYIVVCDCGFLLRWPKYSSWFWDQKELEKL